MTDIGYKRIIELIENYQLYAPGALMRADDFTWWLNGYKACQTNIIAMIKHLMEEQKN